MQAPGGPEEDTTGGFAHGGWLEPVFEEAVGQQIGRLFDGEFDLLLGRRTYEIVAAFWPFMPSDDPIAAKFAKADKYVLTLVEQRTGAGGMLMATYEPAGALRTGSFATQKPSKLELARRRRVKAGDW